MDVNNVIHLLPKGETGGIERLCVDISKKSKDNNYFYFFWGGGQCADYIKGNTDNVTIRNFKYKNIIKEFIFFRNYILQNNIKKIVIHMPSPAIMLFVYLLFPKRNNLSVFLYLHADQKDLFDTDIKKLILKFSIKNISSTIAISHFVKDSYWYQQDLHVLYNGIDTQKFKANDKVQSDCIKLIFVGRLIEVKGVQVLLKALNEISMPYHLTIVGDGNYADKLKELVDVYKLSDKVVFAGTQTNVEEWLEKSDLFIHPAIWKEGFGIALIEAMATGTPCVAYRRGAIPEIITDNVNGFLVEEFNEEDFKERLESVIALYYNDYDKFKTISKNARSRAEVFDIDSYVNGLSDILSKYE